MKVACWIIGAVVLVVVFCILCPDACNGEMRMALRRREEEANREALTQYADSGGKRSPIPIQSDH